MSQYVLAPAAEDDLLVIWHYYAEEVQDPDLADRLVGEMISGFHTIAKTPGIGHPRWIRIDRLFGEMGIVEETVAGRRSLKRSWKRAVCPWA